MLVVGLGPCDQIGNLCEDRPKRDCEHRIVSNREQPTRIGLKSVARLPECVGETKLECCTLVDGSAIHNDEQKITFFQRKDV